MTLCILPHARTPPKIPRAGAGVILSTGNHQASIDVPTTLWGGRTDWLVGGLPGVVGGIRFGTVWAGFNKAEGWRASCFYYFG